MKDNLRTDEIWKSMSSFVEERGLDDLAKTVECFDLHAPKLLVGLQNALRSCDAQASVYRQKGEKGETAYIALSFLDSSILAGTNDLRIDFYDDSFLEDIAEASAYFPYHHLMPIYHESIAAIHTEAEKHFVRVMDCELDGLACEYKDYVLYKMVMTTCSLCLLHPDMVEFWPTLTVGQDCVFTFGRLHNNQQLYLKMPQQKVTI